MTNNMLLTTINNLTKEQRLELHINGMPSSVTSSWRTGKRKPTYAQCVALAAITGCDLERLLLEIALSEAKEEFKEKFAHLLK